MNIWLILIIICFVGVLYLNIVEELKLGKDLEILEIDYIHNQHLQETLRVKQPLIFLMQNGWVLPDSHYFCSFDLPAFASKYGKEKVAVYETWNQEMDMSLEKALALCFVNHTEESEASHRLLWSENNGPLIEETPLQRYSKSCDGFLAPYGTVDTEYDYWFGNAGATMPLRHHNRHSYFLLVLEGEVSVKLAPYKYGKALGNKIVTWNDYMLPSPMVTTKEVEQEVPWMEVQVTKGQCLAIPPWWWHETQFLADSQVMVFMYDNFINSLLTKCREYQQMLSTKTTILMESS